MWGGAPWSFRCKAFPFLLAIKSLLSDRILGLGARVYTLLGTSLTANGAGTHNQALEVLDDLCPISGGIHEDNYLRKGFNLMLVQDHTL